MRPKRRKTARGLQRCGRLRRFDIEGIGTMATTDSRVLSWLHFGDLHPEGVVVRAKVWGAVPIDEVTFEFADSTRGSMVPVRGQPDLWQACIPSRRDGSDRNS